MKARPRRAENSVAAHLNVFFDRYGLSPVERIPVIGRTGPDITINESGLVIDVKSRLEVPKSFFKLAQFQTPEFYCVSLDLLDTLDEPPEVPIQSVLVTNYWKHMDEWTKVHCPDGITAVVLHRPKMPFGKAKLVISISDRRRYYQCLTINSSCNRPITAPCPTP